MLKKLYTLREEFENLDLNTGPELKSVNFTNSVPIIVSLGCFSLCICPCGREHKTQPIHLLFQISGISSHGLDGISQRYCFY